MATYPAVRVLGPLLATMALLATLLIASLQASAQPETGGAETQASGSAGNSGTIKVHDELEESPPTRNVPHVDCEDFWVEGFDLEGDEGRLFVYGWDPTGDRSLALEDNWTADGADPVHHFVAGPYTLPAGHYRVFVQDGEDVGDAPPELGDEDPDASFGAHGMKQKTFWAEPCEPAEDMRCPGDLAAFPQDNGTIVVAFTPDEAADGTNVYRAVGDGDFAYLATVPAPGYDYVDETAEPGTAYAYTVTSLYGAEESTDCPVVEATSIPELPTAWALGLAAGGGFLALALLRRRKA